MIQYSTQELISLTIKDSFRHRNKMIVVFCVISLLTMMVGVNWPKRYRAESLIYVDNRNVITPLMKGTAVTAESKDIAKNAKQIILGTKIIDQVLEYSGWLEKDPDPVERENIIDSIKQKTVIKKVGDSLIKIEFTDADPNKVYLTAKNMAELFVDIGKTNKVEESRSAYEFIEKQASEYLDKLTSVDEKIKRFVTDNPDARPGTQEKATERVTSLKLKYENTKLALREAQIKKKSFQRQLSGEAAMTISQSKEGKYRVKITEMENQLETLLLTYTQTYPDVVRLTHHIKDMKAILESEMKARDEAIRNAKKEGKTYLDSSIATNPIYQQLRSSLSETETEIATLEARLEEMKALLDLEFDRMRRIEEGDSMMQTLTRDYDVNQGIYQDLLKRRENARISRSLDSQQKGSTFTILESAKMPIRPFGIRFMHFLILGILLGVIVPVGVVFGLIQLDGKVRSANSISEEMGVPVLAEIPHYWTEQETHALHNNYRVLILVLSLVAVIYVVASSLKLMGII